MPMVSAALLKRRISAWAARLPRTRTGALLPKLVRALPDARIALVGGAVRDAALERPATDIDVVVSGVPLAKLAAALARSGSVDLVGRRFGVLKWMPRGARNAEPVDVALPRTEHAFGTGGSRDVTVRSDPNLPIEEDLRRRDFTVNALAWDLSAHTLLDVGSGVRDLAERVIRAVGDPKQRFAEDRGRILRAIRFAAQLGFTIELKTKAAIRVASGKLHAARKTQNGPERIVPYEVIAKELVKALVADPVLTLDLWNETGILAAVLPEVVGMQRVPQPRQFHAEGDVYRHTRLALSLLSSPGFRKHFKGYEPSATLVLAVLLHDIGKPPTLKTPTRDGTDRIRFDGHDAAGAVMARHIGERLKLASAGVDVERLRRLVARHLVFTEKTIAAMRATKVEALFVNDPMFGKELLALKYCDGAATINPKGKHTLNSLYLMERRIRQLAPKGRQVPRLLSGHDLMRALKLKPGPIIGTLLEAVREGQLEGTVQTPAQALVLARRVLDSA